MSGLKLISRVVSGDLYLYVPAFGVGGRVAHFVLSNGLPLLYLFAGDSSLYIFQTSGNFFSIARSTDELKMFLFKLASL
jgi:hypothetical protein